MPNFTVIDGTGDGKDWDRQISEQHFEEFVVALLRSLAAGEGSYRLPPMLFRFLEHAQDNKLQVGPVLDAAVRSLSRQAFDATGQEGYDSDNKRVLQAALQMIAESMARDNAARARRSKRADDLNGAIEDKVVNSERRSRENGWSYVARLTEQLGRGPARKR